MSENQGQLMDLIDSKITSVTTRLDHNWSYQFLLGILGLVYLIWPSVGEAIASSTPLKGIPPYFHAIVISVLLMSAFIQHGYLLNYFIRMRELQHKHVVAYYSGILGFDESRLVFERQSPFEPLTRLPKGKWPSNDLIPFVVLILLCATTIMLNHVVVFGMVIKATDGYLRIGCVIAMAIFVGCCYIQFCSYQRSLFMKRISVGLLIFALPIVYCSLRGIDSLHRTISPSVQIISASPTNKNSSIVIWQDVISTPHSPLQVEIQSLSSFIGVKGCRLWVVPSNLRKGFKYRIVSQTGKTDWYSAAPTSSADKALYVTLNNQH